MVSFRIKYQQLNSRLLVYTRYTSWVTCSEELSARYVCGGPSPCGVHFMNLWINPDSPGSHLTRIFISCPILCPMRGFLIKPLMNPTLLWLPGTEDMNHINMPTPLGKSTRCFTSPHLTVVIAIVIITTLNHDPDQTSTARKVSSFQKCLVYIQWETRRHYPSVLGILVSWHCSKVLFIIHFQRAPSR